MKKKVLIITGVLMAIAVILLIIKPFSKKEAEVSFNTVKVERGSITNTVTATGTIEAITTVNVGTQVSGILQHVYVDFNDIVKKGQLLARLDETSLKAQLEQSQSQVDQAQAQLNFQEATFKRLKALYEKELIAQTDYDQALYNYENSKASLSNAKSALARTNVNLEYATITSPIDGVVLNRAVEEGQTVAASFNTPTLFTIVNDLTQMEVQTSVDEADIGKVQQGQRVEFTVDAYSDMKFEGTVSQVRLQPVTTNNVVTYVVILSAPNPEKKLMPGMTASAVIYVQEKNNTLILSGKALRFTPDAAYMKKMFAEMQKNMPGRNTAMGAASSQGTSPSDVIDGEIPAGPPPTGGISSGLSTPEGSRMVWVKDAGAGLRPVPVVSGIDNGTMIEIISGLKEGDEVIISMNSGEVKSTAVKNNAGPPGPFPF
jgi:HlyD family secretion protein